MKRLKRLSLRDEKLLTFLWRWKLVSTSALAVRFFPNSAQGVAYNRLRRLNELGYIFRQVEISGKNPVWVLTKKGFNTIRDFLPALKDEGYKSENPTHDRLVTCAHLGEFLAVFPENVLVFSEQQLRRQYPEDYPLWVPRSTLHRPDGYWKIQMPGKDRTVALEVERHLKLSSAYEVVSEFYARSHQVDDVLWIVPSMGFIRTIIGRTGLDTNLKTKYSFIGFESFERNGWDAQVAAGARVGQSIRQILGLNQECKAHAELMLNGCASMTHALLNSSQRQHITATYKTHKNSSPLVSKGAVASSEFTHR